LLLSCAGFAPAQSIGTDRAIDLTREALRTQRRDIVDLAVDLTDKEKVVFWPLYQQMQSEVQVLGDRRVALIRKIEDSYAASDADVKAGIAEWQRLEQDSVNLRKRYVKRFSKIVPPKTVAKLFQLEAKLDAVTNFDLSGRVQFIE
jgi:hypothetical protein